MANADFSQNQNPNPGGFDAGSYREAAPETETARLTPAQQKLAGLEAALPAALRTQAAALALSVVVMLAAFFGFGGAKLKAKANEAAKWYTVGVSADGGYTLSEELTTRANTALGKIPVGKAVHPGKRCSQGLGESGGAAAKRGTGRKRIRTAFAAAACAVAQARPNGRCAGCDRKFVPYV